MKLTGSTNDLRKLNFNNSSTDSHEDDHHHHHHHHHQQQHLQQKLSAEPSNSSSTSTMQPTTRDWRSGSESGKNSLRGGGSGLKSGDGGGAGSVHGGGSFVSGPQMRESSLSEFSCDNLEPGSAEVVAMITRF